MEENSRMQPSVSASSPENMGIATGLSRPPSLCMKPLPTGASPSPSATSPGVSLTTKEWVIPPRPKPGRKPATDTPPTKRKAQNRAAQRAFRERRAARVGELEEQIKQIEDEHDNEVDTLKERMAQLEEDVERYQTEINRWITRCRQLEADLTNAKAASSNTTRPSATPTRQPSIVSEQPPNHGEDDGGCGNCTLDSHCQCIDDVVKAMNGDIDASQIEKRAPSPMPISSAKRIKLETSEPMEIDFTSAYSRPLPPAPRIEAVSPRSTVADPCGFCQDGTPCICAEMAAEQQNRSNTIAPGSPIISNHPTARRLAQFTPPPSEGDVSSAISAGASSCASGPGTCAQCRADPNSTLFCKSLAASRSQSTSTSQGCCGGKGKDGGCCQGSVPLPSRTTRSRTGAGNVQLPPPVPKPSVTLTCADAYTTLSRHPAYERASGEIATWMPILNANPSGSEGRPAMEIDAANVMAVLKDFDRRFGSSR